MVNCLIGYAQKEDEIKPFLFYGFGMLFVYKLGGWNWVHLFIVRSTLTW